MTTTTFGSLSSRPLLATGDAGGASPAPLTTPAPVEPPSICDNRDVRDLQRRAAGDLIAFEEITPNGDPAFPAAARAWRVLFVSTGKDNNQKTLVCGIVVAPASADAIAIQGEGPKASARMVAWAHGTLGLAPRCQPARNVEAEIWGEPPYGIGAVAWGTEALGNRHAGAPEDGILAGMIGKGWIVAATDYEGPDNAGQPLQPYAVGKLEAVNVIDNMRAAHHLLRAVYSGHAVSAYDAVAWGHSQGGHSAIWTGQLLASYQAATATPDGPAFRLAGVALEAPGANVLTDAARQGEDALGYGFLDWSAHAVMQVTGVPEPIQFGPFLLSYVVGSWASVSRTGAPDAAAMPAFPDLGELDPLAVVTPAGLEAVNKMASICWADGAPVVEATAPFADTPFLVPEFDEGPVLEGARHGNFDRACLNPSSPAAAAWCAWMRWQNPGPLGDHPMDKLPMQDGKLVPVLLMTGTKDGVVHCIAPDPTADAMPPAHDCLATTLYEALAAEYCPSGAADGSLTYLIWREQDGVTDAGHSDVTGLAATAGVDDLRFEGSPLERFMTAAFDGATEPGCRIRVVNGEFQA